MTILKRVGDEAWGAQYQSSHSSGVSAPLPPPPDGARAVMLQPVAADLYVSFDGTVPSATYGFRLAADRAYVFSAELTRSARARAVSTTVTVIQQALA